MAFQELGQRMQSHFIRPEPHQQALAYIQGWMSDAPRKNGWQVAEAFGEAKGEVGLDEYEVRSWHGWFHHITLSMVALVFLAALRANEEENAHKKRLSSQSNHQSQMQAILFKPRSLLIFQ